MHVRSSYVRTGHADPLYIFSGTLEDVFDPHYMVATLSLKQSFLRVRRLMTFLCICLSRFAFMTSDALASRSQGELCSPPRPSSCSHPLPSRHSLKSKWIHHSLVHFLLLTHIHGSSFTFGIPIPISFSHPSLVTQPIPYYYLSSSPVLCPIALSSCSPYSDGMVSANTIFLSIYRALLQTRWL